MPIKSGAIIHTGNGVVIDRIQTGGVSNIGINEEKIYELGNWESVATVRDTPELSFDMESLDVSTEVEALLLGQDPTATIDGDEFDLKSNIPIDIVSPFKSGQGAFDVVRGIVVPYLTLESATYRFGLRQNSTQAFTLRGDSIYYVPGSPRFQEFTIAGVGPYTFDDTAVVYNEGGEQIFALSACMKNPTTGAYKRLFHGDDYSDTANSLTLEASVDTTGYTVLHVSYGTAVVDTYPQSVHQGADVKPAAVRGKDIDIYVSDGAATPTLSRWTGVQSFEVSWRANLENDEEFGNPHYVATDFDTVDVTGTINIKPEDPEDLWDKIAQIADVPTNEVIGPLTTQPLALEARIHDPDTGDLLKTIYVPDARFTLPAGSWQVQQRQTIDFSYSSDGGTMLVYEGARP